jgi:hypothetical protein
MLSHTQQQQYDNPFARNEDTFDFYQEDRSIEPDVDLTGQSSTKQQQQPLINPFANLSGSIGSAIPSTSSNAAQVSEPIATYSGEDTLDEPVSVTIVNIIYYMRRSWLIFFLFFFFFSINSFVI